MRATWRDKSRHDLTTQRLDKNLNLLKIEKLLALYQICSILFKNQMKWIELIITLKFAFLSATKFSLYGAVDTKLVKIGLKRCKLFRVDLLSLFHAKLLSGTNYDTSDRVRKTTGLSLCIKLILLRELTPVKYRCT